MNCTIEIYKMSIECERVTINAIDKAILTHINFKLMYHEP